MLVCNWTLYYILKDLCVDEFIFFCCVLCYVKAHKIQASVPSDLIAMFDEKVEENKVYRMSSMTVKYNIGGLLASYHMYRFIFNENTEVLPSDNNFIPSFGLSLIGAEEVLAIKTPYGYMVGKFYDLFITYS
jgi:hypothetical protein